MPERCFVNRCRGKAHLRLNMNAEGKTLATYFLCKRHIGLALWAQAVTDKPQAKGVN